MGAKQVTVEEFRRDLPKIMYGREVVHIMQDDRIVGVYTPLPPREADWAKYSKLAEEIRAELDRVGMTDEDLEEELAEIDRQRKLKRAG
jgi:hypothetical protein